MEPIGVISLGTVNHFQTKELSMATEQEEHNSDKGKCSIG